MTEIQRFFGKNDEFLEAQFAQALGVPHQKSIQQSYTELIEFTRGLKFTESQFASSQKKWLSIFENVSVHLGFEKLRKLSDVDDKAKHLNACRNEIDPSKFIDTLKSYTDTDSALAGPGLDISPDDWLKSHDVPLMNEIDPYAFKDMLFDVTRFEPALNSEYVFKKIQGWILHDGAAPDAKVLYRLWINSVALWLVYIGTRDRAYNHST